jgi:hypothetical protein
VPGYLDQLNELSDESRGLSSAAQGQLGIPARERLVGGGGEMDPRELLSQLSSGQLGAEQLIALIALLAGLPNLAGGGAPAPAGPALGGAPGEDLGPIGEAMLG